jgi:hypothetical protein
MNPTTNQQQTAQQQTELTTQQSQVTVNDEPLQGDMPPLVNDTPPPGDPKTGPTLSLTNKPFVITPRDSSSPLKPAATNLSGPKLNHHIADGLKHFVSSAKSALAGLSKLAARGSNGSGEPTSGPNSTH